MHGIALGAAALLAGSCSYLEARGADLADSFRFSVGAGLGFAVYGHATDFVSPGIGFMSFTGNFGWHDREVRGVWLESDVINTPRAAYELLAEEYGESSEDQLDAPLFVAKLALSSLNLPNERWLRKGNRLTVEYFSLFNFADVAERQRASVATGYLQRGRERPKVLRKSVWDRGFFEAGGTVGVIHVRAGWNPFQTFDFLAGLFGFDPANDDD